MPTEHGAKDQRDYGATIHPKPRTKIYPISEEKLRELFPEDTNMVVNVFGPISVAREELRGTPGTSEIVKIPMEDVYEDGLLIERYERVTGLPFEIVTSYQYTARGDGSYFLYSKRVVQLQPDNSKILLSDATYGESPDEDIINTREGI